MVSARNGDRIRISPWKPNTQAALMVPLCRSGSIEPDLVAKTVRIAIELGYREAVTAAIAPALAKPFEIEGFEAAEELHLLRHRVEDIVEPTMTFRKARKKDLENVLAVDQAAFDDFWAFDRHSLLEAVRATPKHRFVVTEGPIIAYHISGLNASAGYIQRIAVHPDHHGKGIGTQLVNDALIWFKRQGAGTANVNTQLTNQRALDLYLRLGFDLAGFRLKVLNRSFATG